LGTSVGIAIAERWLAAHFNRPGHELVDFRTFAICGDGDMMEGVSSEAASLAGHLGLHKLLWIYDNNRITIEGGTHLAFSEDVATRFLAYGWNVQHVGDVNDLPALARAIELAGKETSRPSLIIVDSHIGYGAPNKHDTHAAHGEPLGEEEIRLTKKRYGWPEDAKFLVPQEVLDHTRQALKRGAAAEEAWKQQLAAYGQAHPDLAREWEFCAVRPPLPEGWDRESGDSDIPGGREGSGASRESGGKVFECHCQNRAVVLGARRTWPPHQDQTCRARAIFAKGAYGGRNFHFGVREHAMTAICNGMALSANSVLMALRLFLCSRIMRSRPAPGRADGNCL
jgi:transketolase